MTGLDNLEIYRRYDPDGMLSDLHGLPGQCRQAWEKANRFALPSDFKDIDKLVICGMGASAIGGDLLRSLTFGLSKPLVFVNRGYDLPAFVDSKTLVIASSYSGNTEEILSAFTQTLDTRCKKLVITTGGKLGNLAQEKNVPTFTIDYHGQPRAALGYSFIPLIALLSKTGFLNNQSSGIEGMAQSLEALLHDVAENVATPLNPAKQLAGKLFGKLVVIYGAGILSAVAQRWKDQCNENSKTWAFYETLSELNHNAVVGYEFPKEVTGKAFILMLRCPSLHPRVLSRYQITSEILKKAAVGHEIVDSQGKEYLTQMMSLVFLGDWVSYYLAILNHTDPTPVKAIDYLKKRLSGTNT
ncbi:MAG: bifunctional phosphoglucose/phosphomannose isomerase [Dehalococcoidia bacterium]|nr:bifunctional phosphoglucose/phosphomannose isomerase [Dehalococcoidia bacterium]